ncbi:MAG: hypothetical protein LBI58_06090 [Tannerellaceae bacterium]|jgi:hypothetical protein|nr:hypothetical protein [Tannerellaceae bacterium]
MKRSTFIFALLLVALFVAPFIVAGIFNLISPDENVVMVKWHYPVIWIDNPSLKAADVNIAVNSVNDRTQRWSSVIDAGKMYYYRGNERYHPSVRSERDTLYIGKPRDMAGGSLLKLHVPGDRTDKVFLNGELIYGR